MDLSKTRVIGRGRHVTKALRYFETVAIDKKTVEAFGSLGIRAPFSGWRRRLLERAGGYRLAPRICQHDKHDPAPCQALTRDTTNGINLSWPTVSRSSSRRCPRTRWAYDLLISCVSVNTFSEKLGFEDRTTCSRPRGQGIRERTCKKRETQRRSTRFDKSFVRSRSCSEEESDADQQSLHVSC